MRHFGSRADMCTNPDHAHCTPAWAEHLPKHRGALLRGTGEHRQGGSEVCTLLQGSNSFCVTHYWKRFPRELRNLSAESLTKITVTENLRHREIKIPCPKPFQSGRSHQRWKLNLALTSECQTQDSGLFFSFEVLECVKHFLITRNFIKLGHSDDNT